MLTALEMNGKNGMAEIDNFKDLGLVTKENFFNLDPSIYRTSEERVNMVEHPDCPVEVLKIVAEFDLDQEVLEAIHSRKDLPPTVKRILKPRLHKTVEELEAVAVNRQHPETVKKQKVFCAIPWNHVSTNADGSVRMCCQMIQPKIEPVYGTLFKPDGKPYTGLDNPDEYRNHPALKEIRSAMLKGIDPSICKLCTQEEANGIGSRRSGVSKSYPGMFQKAKDLTLADGHINPTDFPIEYLDLRFGNKCNLKCRSCGPTDSNLWYEDFYKIRVANGEEPTYRYRDHDVMTIEEKDGVYTVDGMLEWWNESGLWDYIVKNIKTIDRYYFTGGEPTINQKHRELLDLIIEAGVADKVILEYNTNMASLPNKVFSQWKNFKRVQIGMSVDGIYEHFEYIRAPGKWSTAEKNLRRMDTETGLDNVYATVSLTLSTYNVLHLLDYIWWWREQGWNRLDPIITVHNLYGPFYMNVQNMPVEMKQWVDKRYNQFMQDINKRWREDDDRYWKRRTMHFLRSVLQHMWDKEPDTREWKRFLLWTRQLDEIRNEKFEDSCPEMYNLIETVRKTRSRKQGAKLKTANKKG